MMPSIGRCCSWAVAGKQSQNAPINGKPFSKTTKRPLFIALSKARRAAKAIRAWSLINAPSADGPLDRHNGNLSAALETRFRKAACEFAHRGRRPLHDFQK